MLKYTFIFVLLFYTFGIQAQQVWTLEQCLNYIEEEHPMVRQSELDLREAALNYQAMKNNRLPFVGASTSFGMQFGRTVDPTTNAFDNQSISYNGWGLNADWTIFSGGLKQRILEQKQRMKSSRWTADETIFLLQLDVIEAYYACLLTESQLAQAKLNTNSLEEQVRNLQRQVDSGTRSVTDRMELEAQLTQSKQTEVQTTYRLRQRYNDLKNVLFLTPSTDILVTQEEINEVEIIAFQAETAVAYYPGLLAQQANIEAAQTAIKGTKQNVLPSVSLFGGMNTNYSSALMDKAYLAQLNENFGQNLGVFVTIPILNQGRNNIDQQRANIALERSQVALEQQQQTLNFVLQQIKQDLESTKLILESAKENMDLQARLEAAQKRSYQMGVSNQLQYLIARNQHQTAVQTWLAAKYDYAYQLAIAHFYQQDQR